MFNKCCFNHRLYTCEADLEKASSSLESHRHDVKERDGKIHRLTSELRARAVECERLQKILGQQQHGQERMRQEAELRMYSLRVGQTGCLFWNIVLCLKCDVNFLHRILLET